MIEVGKVVKADAKKATVEFERKTECDKCGMCAFKKEDMFVKCTIDNKLGAKVGEYVSVHMGKNYVLVAALIAYMMPLVIAGIALACTIMLEEYIQFIAVCVSLVLGFTAAALLDKFVIRKKSGFRPTMVGIVNITKPKAEEDEENE